MNTQEELRKEIVSLQKGMKSLLNTVNTIFDIVKDNREFIQKNADLCCKTTKVLKDLADIAGNTMKVDAEEIKVSNKMNGGVPSIKKPTSMKDVGLVDLSSPKAQKEFLKKVEKLNSKYNES
ncbi:MAG: hypothetical protein CMH62_01555 [Nanoarchaeota archaeon]|jgi:hypothetical protein|nr:hypothetical protein [Nanoarchaeota archaeon]|tara:strand:- start:8005 stop:8370 length:366 start_codon:yes stop_codon:yes gene_type:complete